MEVSRQFAEVYDLIVGARERAFQAVNKELIDRYWKVGAYISIRVEQEEWGKGVVGIVPQKSRSCPKRIFG